VVKVSTRVLPLRCSSTQRAKLQPKYTGPLTVKEKLPAGAYRLELPDHYSAVYDAFDCVDLRPWLHHEDRFLERKFPHVMPHPSFDRIIQVVDRKKLGQSPAFPANLLDIPAQYLLVRQSGKTEWVRQSWSADPDYTRLVARLETLFPRLPAAAATLFLVTQSLMFWMAMILRLKKKCLKAFLMLYLIVSSGDLRRKEWKGTTSVPRKVEKWPRWTSRFRRFVDSA
jgi:hypothetical protein